LGHSAGRKIWKRVGNIDRGIKRRFSESERGSSLLPSPPHGKDPRSGGGGTTFLHRTPQQRQIHCNENPIYVFLFWELRGVIPNFHIHVSMSDLYIPSTHISCSRIGRSIVGTYKSLTDRHMKVELGLWPRSSFPGNIYFEFSVLVLCSVRLRDAQSRHDSGGGGGPRATRIIS
jgi:hypothetical protein